MKLDGDGQEPDEAGQGTDRPSLAMCCATTIALVQRLRRTFRCPVCDGEYAYNEATAPMEERVALVPEAPALEVLAPRRASSPGARPDARVQVADEARLRPSSVAPVARVTRVEDGTAVRLRRLVIELRAAELDGAGAPAIVYRERVQSSGTAHLPPSLGRSTVHHPVTERLAALRPAHPREVATLLWLRAWGPAYELLSAGKASLVLAQCARALGSDAQHVAWAKAPAGAEVWARAALERAARVWWAEGLDGESPKSSNEEPRPPVATGRALSVPPADPAATPTT